MWGQDIHSELWRCKSSYLCFPTVVMMIRWRRGWREEPRWRVTLRQQPRRQLTVLYKYFYTMQYLSITSWHFNKSSVVLSLHWYLMFQLSIRSYGEQWSPNVGHIILVFSWRPASSARRGGANCRCYAKNATKKYCWHFWVNRPRRGRGNDLPDPSSLFSPEFGVSLKISAEA